MFEKLGNLVSRHPWWFLVIWPIFGLIIIWRCPSLTQNVHEGISARLPARCESYQVDQFLADHFKGYNIDSSDLVILLYRKDGLLQEDYDNNIPLIVNKLKEYTYKTMVDGKRVDIPAIDPDVISVLKNPAMKSRLDSDDHTTTIIAARLRIVFISSDTRDIVKSFIRFMDKNIASSPGLQYYITGSAVVGHDYGDAVDDSLGRTEVVTYIMVVVILILIYRSPLAAIIPLLTILLSLRVAMSIVAVFAKYVTLIPTLVPTFMTVVIFGAGTNYCLFLVGRYKEELGRGLSYKEAASLAISQVGRALGASASTEVLGLVLLVFAEFDIFSRTGIAVGLSIVAALVAAMTLAPAAFLVLKDKAFWPGRADAAIAGTFATRIWRWVAAGVCRRPVLILTVGLGLMAPFMYFGAVMTPSYDVFAELPSDMKSVEGYKFRQDKFGNHALEEQLSAIITSDVDMTSIVGINATSEIVNRLLEEDPKHKIVEVRSIITPLGRKEAGWMTSLLLPESARNSRLIPAEVRDNIKQAYDHYISQDHFSTKIDIVLKWDSFSHQAMDAVPGYREKLQAIVAASGLQGATVKVGGLSAYMNDLRDVTSHDLRRLVILVSIMVYIVLVFLMRDWFSPIYMLGTMVISYLVTMGVADLFFHYVLHQQGLDWKVRFFLFVLLIAIGEDYNIYLMSRVREESIKHGVREGVRRAIIYTGSIISACGLIMAGTFGAMMAARIALMVHIGFAMTLGILLDTFIIRPVIVPCIVLIFRRLHVWHKYVRVAPEEDKDSTV